MLLTTRTGTKKCTEKATIEFWGRTAMRAMLCDDGGSALDGLPHFGLLY